jgi:hypothetical protein
MFYWKVNIFDILALLWVGSGLGLFMNREIVFCCFLERFGF